MHKVIFAAILRFGRLSISVMAIFIIGAASGRGQMGPIATNDISPVSPSLCQDMMRRHVLSIGAPVGCERLRIVKFSYVDFEGQVHQDGQLVTLDAVARHVLSIFETLRIRKFPISSARLMNEFDGNDDRSMDRNNTSAFNHRNVTGGASLSPHSFGVAIDINPVQNPYLGRSGGKLIASPKAGEAYLDRKAVRPGMAENIVDVFLYNGFSVWGGYWKNPIDYQHFQTSRKLTQQLVRSAPAQAKILFEQHVARYRACIGASRDPKNLRTCAAVD